MMHLYVDQVLQYVARGTNKFTGMDGERLKELHSKSSSLDLCPGLECSRVGPGGPELNL